MDRGIQTMTGQRQAESRDLKQKLTIRQGPGEEREEEGGQVW